MLMLQRNKKDSASPHRPKKLNEPISVCLTKIVIPVEPL
jgi:hypothetical protein